MASGPLSVGSLGGGAAHSSSVLESSDDSGSHVSADLLLLLSESVKTAIEVSLSEGSDKSCSSPGTNHSASGPLDWSTSVDSALLWSSSEASHHSGLSESS